MEQNASTTPAARTPSPAAAFKRRMPQPRTLGLIALALALGAAGTGIGWRIWLKPLRLIAERRYRTHMGLCRLYDLQRAYHGGHGTFADDLESLLASAPDGAELREILRANADYGTLTVVGDASRFRLEANVLDPERTLIKIRGGFAAKTGPSRPSAPPR